MLIYLHVYIFRPHNKTILLFLCQYIQWIGFHSKTFRIWLENLLGPAWEQLYLHDKARGERSSLQILQKQPGTSKPDLQEYERHYRDLPEKWKCSFFTALFRSTEEENLQHISCKGSCTPLSAVTLSSCALVRVNFCIIEGEHKKKTNYTRSFHQHIYSQFAVSSKIV